MIEHSRKRYRDQIIKYSISIFSFFSLILMRQREIMRRIE